MRSKAHDRHSDMVAANDKKTRALKNKSTYALKHPRNRLGVSSIRAQKDIARSSMVESVRSVSIRNSDYSSLYGSKRPELFECAVTIRAQSSSTGSAGPADRYAEELFEIKHGLVAGHNQMDQGGGRVISSVELVRGLEFVGVIRVWEARSVLEPSSNQPMERTPPRYALRRRSSAR